MSARLILLAVIAASGGDRYYATEQYCTRAADTPANTLFEGRLVDAIYERAVSFPVWNRAGGAQAISYLELVNIDGALDDWLDDDWKDVRITLKLVEARAAYSTATQVGVAVVERLEAPSAERVRFVCRSVFERLEKVITTNYSDSITNEQLRGKPKPLTLGRVRWFDPSNSRLYASPTRGFYDVADGPFESIVELRDRGAYCIELQSPILPPGTPYFVYQDTDTGYGYNFNERSNRHAVELRGQQRLDTQALTHSTFPSGTGGNPDGWTVSEPAGTSVVWNSAGSVTLTSDGTDTVSLLQTLTTVAGAHYRLEVDIETGSGVLDMRADGNTIRSPEVNSLTVAASFTASGTSTPVGVQFVTGASGALTISAIRCYRAYRIDTLAEIVRLAGVTRGTLSTGDLNLTALAAIDTAAGYAIGWSNVGGEVRGIDLVGLAAQSFGVAIFQNANGELTPVRIAEPAVSADFELDEFSIVEIGWEADEAPGLSTRMNYGRNYAPHSTDDMSGLPTNGTAAALRAELARDVRVVTTTEALHAVYSEAEERDPLASLLSEEADAQDEIDRICALYTQPRAFFTLKAYMPEATAYTIEPGHTVAVTHSRYGLSGGKNLLVVAARSDFLGNAVDLVLWG